MEVESNEAQPPAVKPSTSGTSSSSKKQNRVSKFIDELDKTNVSRNTAVLQLVRKRNDRKKYLDKARKQKERIRKLMKDLKTTETQIDLINGEIEKLHSVVAEGTDDESD